VPVPKSVENQQPKISEGRLRALHRASLSLVSDLSLQGVLERIVDAARELSDARFAALGIADAQGKLETFITSGMKENEIKRIAHPPQGKGLIGEMMRRGQAIRIPEIAEHPRAVGFPPGHPEMHSFLGVPISAYGRSIGQLYLTDKQGAASFSEQDQQLIEMLAAHAAAAIENARLHRSALASERELAQRNEELELVNSLATAASSTVSVDELLGQMIDQTLELFQANSAEIYLREESSDSFRLAMYRGESAAVPQHRNGFREGEGWIGGVVADGRPAFSRLAQTAASPASPEEAAAGPGTVACIPLTAKGEVVGVLNLAYLGEREFTESELGLLEAVGAGIGIAVENARLSRQARRLAVLEERERIGMDLHDGIIQSIYAVGLNLDYARLISQENQDQIGERLAQSIDQLNAVIRDIRAYILDLQPSRIATQDLGHALDRLVREFRSNSLIEVEVRLEPEIVKHLDAMRSAVFFHIAQEALANIAKHANASRVWISLREMDDELIFQVADNGRGFDTGGEPRRLGHGLSNMAERARQAGGAFEAISSPGEGSTISIRIKP
jgi:two-component system sensor histidine kinase DevS